MDLPFTIHNLILGALGFLSFDELPDEERPPKNIWLDGDKMKAWWVEIRRMREARDGGHGDQASMEHSDVMSYLKIVGPSG